MDKLYKQLQSVGFFEQEYTLEKLKALGNPLETLSSVIDFEMFRDLLETNLYNVGQHSKAGARPFDVILMFKIMLLQRFYNLGDESIEYQIKDRISFRHFLGITSVDAVPDSRTIWLFREKLSKSDIVEKLFETFNTHLCTIGLDFKEGKIIDASFVVCPRQKITKEEKEQIKSGKGKELWKEEPHKKCHKDIDAGWTVKNMIPYYGYKNHIKVDNKSKLINTYVVTNASVHDSDTPRELLTEKDKGQKVYADSAYSGLGYLFERKEVIKEVCSKGQRCHPLTEEQKLENRRISKTRARVEHVFGFMEGAMHGLTCRLIGLPRAKVVVGLVNLFYNMFRFEQLVRYELCGIQKSDFIHSHNQ